MSAEPSKKKVNGLTRPMKVSDDLEAIIGVSEASRAQCIKHLWAYLKEKNLQNADNKAFFTPDKKMAKVFGKDSIRGISMSKYLGAHLSAIDDWEVCLSVKSWS